MATTTITAPMNDEDFDKAVTELWHQLQANKKAAEESCSGICATNREIFPEPFTFAPTFNSWWSEQALDDPGPEDMVNHPGHYTSAAVEPLELFYQLFGDNPDIIYGGLMFNVLKYTVRAPYKGKPEEDKEKALFYLNEFKRWFPEIGMPKIG